MTDFDTGLCQLPRDARMIVDLHPSISTATEEAWILATLMFQTLSIRSGHIIVAILRVPSLRAELFAASPEFKKISIAELTEQFDSILTRSVENDATAHNGTELARGYLERTPPEWMPTGDELMELYRKQGLLLREGLIVWGALVQANSLLFSPGKTDLPAMVVYAPDKSLDAYPEWLESLATYLFNLKGTKPEDPGERRLADMITDEMERALGWTLPPHITGGKVIRSTIIVVIRDHLPEQRLEAKSFPLLVHPDCGTAMIVASKFWPPSLALAAR